MDHETNIGFETLASSQERSSVYPSTLLRGAVPSTTEIWTFRWILLVLSIMFIVALYRAECDVPLREVVLAVFLLRCGKEFLRLIDAPHYLFGILALATFVLCCMAQYWWIAANKCDAVAKYYVLFLLVTEFYPVVGAIAALIVVLAWIRYSRGSLEFPSATGAAFANQGIAPTVLNKLKSYILGASTGESCSVCMEKYKPGDVIRQLPCKHEYHTACVDQWLSAHQECPLCRNNVQNAMDALV